MVDGVIRKIIDATFTKTSALLHTLWFGFWFAKSLSVGLLTNVVSLEAIYLAIFIGYIQKKHVKSGERHHDILRRLLGE